MTQYEIKRADEDAMQVWELINDIYSGMETHGAWRRFRHCTAEVQAIRNDKGDRIYILRSYNTIVAAVLEYNSTFSSVGKVFLCVDMLRFVYGYTATSAQHIAKFFNDYARFPARCMKSSGESVTVIERRHSGKAW